MKTYIGTKVLQAQPETREGREGYAVLYADGYRSWSPKEPFEEAYRAVEMVNFGDALFMLKRGHRMARAGWNGKGMWLELQRPDAGSKMTLPYIYMKTADDQLVPWLASQTDMLAEDWVVL